MINYIDWDEKLNVMNIPRLLVVYKEGTKTRQELISLHKLKSFVFYSDESELRMNICGFQLGGIIVEEGANLNYYNFRYTLTRLSPHTQHFIFSMNNQHLSRLNDIYEEYIASVVDYDNIERMKRRIMLYRNGEFRSIKLSEWRGENV